MIVYFIFSSITFLQFYIPLVLEFKKNNHSSNFIIRPCYKDYANPFSKENFPILIKYAQKYHIRLIDSRKINIRNIKGIVFMVEGDICGPPQTISIYESLLGKLDEKNTIRISLVEHMNYKWAYQYYISKINYVIFQGRKFIKQIIYDRNLMIENEKKNLFLGNTKFDNIPGEIEIYKKYNLDKNDKYCLILFPKIQFRNDYSDNELLNIYNIIKELDYKIIVKTRPKDNIEKFKIEEKFRGDNFICSDIYPNESLELMKVCDLCIMFSSSASDETLFCKIPTLDFPVIWERLGKVERNEFLIDDKIFKRVSNWRKIKRRIK